MLVEFHLKISKIACLTIKFSNIHLYFYSNVTFYWWKWSKSFICTQPSSLWISFLRILNPEILTFCGLCVIYSLDTLYVAIFLNSKKKTPTLNWKATVQCGFESKCSIVQSCYFSCLYCSCHFGQKAIVIIIGCWLEHGQKTFLICHGL